MRSKKILKLFILMIGVFFIGLSGVKASYTIEFSGDNAVQITESKVGVSPAMLSSYLHTYYRKTTNNQIVYCYDANVTYNAATTTYSNCSTVTSNRTELAYIFTNGYGGKNSYSTGNDLEDYFITQLAAWKFANPGTLMNGFQWYTSNNKLTGEYCDNDKNCSHNEITLKVAELVNDAMDYSGSSAGSVSLTSSTTKMSLTSDGKYYISGPISVKGTNIDGNISLTVSGMSGAFVATSESATSGVSSISSSRTVYIKVPASSVTASGTVKLLASATTNPEDGTITRCSYNSSKQSIMGYTPGNSKNVSDSGEFTITYTPTIKKYPVTISKKSTISTAELKGAVLVIKNSSKTVVDRWTTDGSVHTANLESGTYTLEEESAPAGYTKSSEVITFVVGTDGKITVNGKVVTSLELKNTPDRIMISKVDSITGKELAGATLVIKDSSGKPVQTITTKGNPEPISLSPGEYTLEETTAPKGYIKNTKVIKFTVTSNNKITIDGKEASYVEMENDPIIIYISKKSINGKTELPGATLVITDKDGNLKEDLDGKSLTWTSTTDITKFHLAPGTYYLYETKAPKGYELSDKKLEFTILEDGTVKMDTKTVDDNILVFTNTPEPTPVQTGSLLVYIIIIGTIAVGVVTYYVMKQDKLRV